MNDLKSTLHQVKASFSEKLNLAKNSAELEAIRVEFLTKKGIISELMGRLGALSIDDKKIYGPLIQELKRSCEEAFELKKQTILSEKPTAETNFDVSAYLPHQQLGSLHPYTHFIKEIEQIFSSMGFALLQGPEVETDYYNFGALNIPPDHPARDMYDTFWLNVPNMLLRTHTSSVQARAIAERGVPLAGISVGRVFRHEAVDASHDIMFMQCEGIMIDKNITLAHLFGVVQEFIQTLFNTKSLTIRTRPGFFPFVEPGVEIDMQCPFCKAGCSTCKKTRWIEVFPGGLIHPNVLEEAGIDHTQYSGFAFGFGLTRLAMLKYGIRDIRAFHSGKVGFLEQFN